jgi:hypothetical protein
MSKTYRGSVQDHFGELVLVLPDDLLADMGWFAGNMIEWIVEGDGMIRLMRDEKRLAERGWPDRES